LTNRVKYQSQTAITKSNNNKEVEIAKSKHETINKAIETAGKAQIEVNLTLPWGLGGASFKTGGGKG